MRWYVPTLVLVVIALFSFLYFSKLLRTPIFKYERSGGIVGFIEEFNFYDDGEVLFRDLKSGTQTTFYLNETLSNLIRLLCGELSKASPIKIEARSGAADFFIYRLKLSGKEFEWVDEWATDETIPEHLLDFHKLTSAIINEKLKKSFTSYELAVYKKNVTLEVELKSYLYHVNESVAIKILIMNNGDSEINYISPTPCHPDFLINSDMEYEIEFIKPKFSKDTVCVQVIDMRKLDPGTILENLAVMSFKNSGITHITVKFPPTTIEREIAELTIPIFIYD